MERSPKTGEIPSKEASTHEKAVLDALANVEERKTLSPKNTGERNKARTLLIAGSRALMLFNAAAGQLKAQDKKEIKPVQIIKVLDGKNETITKKYDAKTKALVEEERFSKVDSTKEVITFFVDTKFYGTITRRYDKDGNLSIEVTQKQNKGGQHSEWETKFFDKEGKMVHHLYEKIEKTENRQVSVTYSDYENFDDGKWDAKKKITTTREKQDDGRIIVSTDLENVYLNDGLKNTCHPKGTVLKSTYKGIYNNGIQESAFYEGTYKDGTKKTVEAKRVDADNFPELEKFKEIINGKHLMNVTEIIYGPDGVPVQKRIYTDFFEMNESGEVFYTVLVRGLTTVEGNLIRFRSQLPWETIKFVKGDKEDTLIGTVFDRNGNIVEMRVYNIK